MTDARFLNIEDIKRYIAETPMASEREIREYHRPVMEALDSGVIVGAPSILHRNLVQMVWIAGFCAMNGYTTEEDKLKFFKEEGRDNQGRFGSQRDRFNAWYDQTYITPCLSGRGNFMNWLNTTHNSVVKSLVDKGLDEYLVEVS